MVQEGEAPTTEREAVVGDGQSRPRSLQTSERGIRTGADFATFMSSLISDIIARRVTPEVGNAACNAGGKLLKVVEMQYKFGNPSERNGAVLVLAAGVTETAPV